MLKVIIIFYVESVYLVIGIIVILLDSLVKMVKLLN